MLCHRNTALGLAGLALLASTSLAGNASQTVTGRIESVQPSAQQVTVRTEQGKELVLHVDKQARLEQQGKGVALDRFSKGMPVRVTFVSRNGRNEVVTLAPAVVSARDVENQVREALKAVKSYTFEHKDEYRQRLQHVLRQADARIDQLQRKAGQVGAQARTQYQEEIVQLRRLRDRAQVQMNRVESASPAVWNDLKTGVSSAFEDLRKAFEKAGEHFR